MGNNYVFSLTPTFTQGLLLGQLSILVLLGLVLKYLFFVPSIEVSETQPFVPRIIPGHPPWNPTPKPDEGMRQADAESAEWFNLLTHQVVDFYRAKLQNGLPGCEGNEFARQQIEAYANTIRPPSFLDYITVHAVDLGNTAPRLSNIRQVHTKDTPGVLPHVQFDMSYTDTISVSLSTTYLLNFPVPSFARLPVSLTVSLSRFESDITLSLPSPGSVSPVLTISLPPDFTLALKTTSLMGSRTMLNDVPKLHDLIEYGVRRALAAKGTWKVALPCFPSTDETKAEAQKGSAVDSCS